MSRFRTVATTAAFVAISLGSIGCVAEGSRDRSSLSRRKSSRAERTNVSTAMRSLFSVPVSWVVTNFCYRRSSWAPSTWPSRPR